MKYLIPLALVCVLCLSCQSQRGALVSPNGQIGVKYNDENRSFSVVSKNGDAEREVLNIAGLGMSLANDTDSFALVSCSRIMKVTDDYEMLSGKRSRCHNEACERVYSFDNGAGLRLDLVMRAYNDGIAFRYHFPDVGSDGVEVTGENTEFGFAAGVNRWTQKFVVGYEGFYDHSTDGVAGNEKRQWNMPALFEADSQTFVLLAEANVLRDNCGAFLSNKDNADTYKVEYPEEKFICRAGWYSPWRVAMIGSLADVVESTLITDVSDPCKLGDTSWVKPGVVSWIYWAYNHGSKDYQIVKKYIDFAHDFGLPYVLIDWEWDVMGNGGNLDDALRHCKEKGVAPLLWYNSSTAWCGPEPLYRLNTPESRNKEFAWLKDMGVKGIKVDFFGGDSIPMTNYYIDILEDAAKYGLMVNFHGGTIPRGWQRTYPNYMSSEAVYGAEWYNNNGVLTNKAARHNCTLPFTRNVIGPMDYTPCAFTDSQHPHITSDAHELALLVVFESALQHLADRPEGFTAQPAEVRSFVSGLPAAWDDTRLLGGYPGKSVAIARRTGDTWYVGVLNGMDEVQTIGVDWSFLGEGEWTVTSFADKKGDKKEWDIDSKSGVKTADLPSALEIKERGGYVSVLRK